MKNNQLTFYTNPQSRGLIVRWMLEELAIDYDEQIIDYGDAMQAEQYLAINPMAKVPAIKHRGEIITETAAICTYLADAFPQAGLAPSIENRAAYYRWLFFAAGPLEAAITNNNLGINLDAEKERTVGYGSYDKVMKVLDDFLSQAHFVCGEQFTAADVYLGSHVAWGLQFQTIPKSSGILAYLSRFEDRPAFKRVMSATT